MKQTNLFILTLFSFFLISCSLSEELTFYSDGKINLNYSLNSSLLKSEKDTLYSLQNISISDNDYDLSPLHPLMVEINGEKKILKIYGTFANAEELNKAIQTLKVIGQEEKGDTIKFSDLDKEIGIQHVLYNLSAIPLTEFSWDGITMKRIFSTSPNLSKKEQEKLYLSNLSGKYKQKYSFQTTIKSVSDSNALFSWDQKNTFIEHSLSDIINSPEKLSIKIEVEK